VSLLWGVRGLEFGNRWDGDDDDDDEVGGGISMFVVDGVMVVTVDVEDRARQQLDWNTMAMTDRRRDTY